MDIINNLTIIAAVGKNLELGKNNDLIWCFKEDMKFFKENTLGKPIVMGMKTFNSLPKLLEDRKHIVLTKKNIKIQDVIVMHSKEEVLNFTKEYKQEVMIIGGASIYKEFLNYAKKLLLTEIDAEDREADTYFPNFDKDDWSYKVLSKHKENNILYKHVEYIRKQR